jgi:hypothetical protein
MPYYGVGSEWVSGKVKAVKLLEHEVATRMEERMNEERRKGRERERI